MFRNACVFMFVFAGMACGGIASAESLAVGRVAPGIELQDTHGATCSLAAVKDARLVVVAFLGTECPLVTNIYAPRLEALSKKYLERNVRVIAIDSNAQDSREDVQEFVSKQSLTFPVLLDNDAKVADAFGAM